MVESSRSRFRLVKLCVFSLLVVYISISVFLNLSSGRAHSGSLMILRLSTSSKSHCQWLIYPLGNPYWRVQCQWRYPMPIGISMSKSVDISTYFSSKHMLAATPSTHTRLASVVYPQISHFYWVGTHPKPLLELIPNRQVNIPIYPTIQYIQ